MKRKLITLVLTLGFLAAFGVFMHSPPSILDGLTGATPKAKRAAPMAAPLEGNYLFCIVYCLLIYFFSSLNTLKLHWNHLH